MKRKTEADYRRQLEEERQLSRKRDSLQSNNLIGLCKERKIKRGKYMDMTVMPYAVEGSSNFGSVRLK